MPITITIEASNAEELKQLIQDAASTLAGMRIEDIEDTKVSTLETYQSKQVSNDTDSKQPAAVPVQAPVNQPVPNPKPVAPTTAHIAPAAPTVPTATPTYDFNQLATATMQLQQAGHNIQELFAQFGIQSLNQLPKERYGEYANVLRQRGAKI